MLIPVFGNQLRLKLCSRQLNIFKNLTLYQQFDIKCKKVKHFSNKWLITAHLQLSQKSLKTCLRKMTIIAPFISRNSLFFISKNQKKNKKKREKNLTHFLLFNFRNCPKKGAKGDAVYIIVNALKVFLNRMKQKRPLEKNQNLKNKKKIIIKKKSDKNFLF